MSATPQSARHAVPPPAALRALAVPPAGPLSPADEAREADRMAVRLVCRALLPLLKVILQQDARLLRSWAKVDATIQIEAADDRGERHGVCLHFKGGQLELSNELSTAPTVRLAFSSLGRMRAFFRGRPSLPRVHGWRHLGLIVRFVRLLKRLEILHPRVRPKSPDQRALKVRLSLYMITTALSQYNKGGNRRMQAWTQKQPERIYQLSVSGTDIGAYLRVKGGRSQSGRGLYTRRRPFVHTRFCGVDGALTVLLKDADTMTAMKQGLLETEGAPEYAGQMSDLMLEIQGLVS